MRMTPSGPIVIIGIMQRSGTNWLRDLLLCHPDCYGAKIQEDFLLANSRLLMRFGSSLYRTWPEKWRAPDQVGPEERLQRLLGNALLDFIGQEPPDNRPVGGHEASPGRRLVTKTPSTANLRYCFNFFPTSQLVILVRDGRAVVESIVRGFAWDYETAIRRWDSAAREILDFMATEPDRGRVLLLKYEDLYSAPRPTLERLLTFLHLDPGPYDFESAIGLPIRGSSVPEDAPDSAPGSAPQAGDPRSPMQRAAGWDRWKHERFNRVAGASLAALGYQPVTSGPVSPSTTLKHWLHDLRWSAPRRLLSVGYLLKRAVGRSEPDFRDARSVYYVRERLPVVRATQAEPPRTAA